MMISHVMSMKKVLIQAMTAQIKLLSQSKTVDHTHISETLPPSLDDMHRKALHVKRLPNTVTMEDGE